MNLSKLTPKQQEIIRLIYRYRFITRKQIQSLLGHTDKRRISAWLKELREQQFVNWFYDRNDPYEPSTPAVYFLDINGIRFLRQTGEYAEGELRKRYKDATRQQGFIDRCLLLADCAVHLEARTKDDGVNYTYALEADYTDPSGSFCMLGDSEFIHPDLAFTKEAETDEGYVNQTYFVQFFDLTMPRYMVKKKLKGYVEYFDSEEPEQWRQQMDQEELPIVLVACPTLAELIYAKRYAKKQLQDNELDEREDVRIWFATIQQVKRQGVTGLIWEDV
ncbi:MAG TPA: replication-relaxation family protein [Candidatus Saccharimonadales bacterium]|nr:replication-relaxation family protein [Candidatus Saccharimonadales bacterium]